jgi:hypothetical protein
MELKDFLVTPIFLMIIYFFAYRLRNKYSDKITRRYFIPALTVKIIGAICLGLIYQFYYGGGDTFNFYTHGSRHIWDAFLDSPIKAIQLIFADGSYQAGTYKYAARIWFYKDLPSYFVVRVSAFFGVFTFHTYTAIACFFAVLSFSGLWACYQVFVERFPDLHKELALAFFFMPSVFFWGSGIMKDTLTLGALTWVVFALINLVSGSGFRIKYLIILVLSCYVLFVIKIYILMALLPAAMIWLFLKNVKRIKAKWVRVFVAPVAMVLGLITAFVFIAKLSENNEKYSVNKMAETAEVTATYLSRMSIESGGSGYTLGDFDFSTTGMIKKFPAAVWVSLFRPYLWEVRNPIMLLSALESLFLLIISLYLIFKIGLIKTFQHSVSKPIVLFCLVFSIGMAFAVGLTSYNFGTLVRYKIPLMPFFLSALFIMNQLANSRRVELYNNSL